jgi:2,4-dienoyl-CoA reductase-like NADH-dependent reductase (Old Yellow Enzyme family)
LPGEFWFFKRHGPGAVWTAIYPFQDRIPKVQKMLNLPEQVIPLNIIPVGYPAEKKMRENLYDPSRCIPTAGRADLARLERGKCKDTKGTITMPALFESTTINGMSLANRFVRSATWEGMADTDGTVTSKLIDMMMELAKGEVGLIISGHAFVKPEGQVSPRQLAVYEERFLPGLQDMVRAVHTFGGKIALQLAHGGCKANSELSGLTPFGPSAVEKNGQAICRMATLEDIASIVSAFARATDLAKQTGFDAVQIHAAHGFLLSQFLSPAFNKRTDEYGGELVNRARLLLEVVRGARGAAGPDYPILIKINSEDFLTDGMSHTEAVEVSGLLEQASIDAIEFSGGTAISPEKFLPVRPGILKTPEQEVYYRTAARLYKQEVTIPLILVGGIRSYEVAEELVQDGQADYISLSRPLICEPRLVKRWREGDHRKAECVSDNACFAPGLDGRGIYCVTMAKKRSKTDQ